MIGGINEIILRRRLVMKKRVLSSILIIAILIAATSTCLASWGEGINPTPGTPSGASGMTTTINSVLGAAQWIGFIVAIAMLIYVGIKYLTSGAGKKAEAKETLIPMLIGAVLVVLAPTIAKAVFNTIQPSGTTASTNRGGGGNNTVTYEEQ